MSAGEAPEAKEWFKVTRSPRSGTQVTCTRQEGNHTAKYTALASVDEKGIKAGVQEARSGARTILRHLEKALADLGDEEL